jgi:hypothetical protein
MPNPIIGMVGASVGGAAVSASAQKKAADKASAAQIAAAEKGIAEQRRQFDEAQKLLQPYIGAGQSALAQQLALIGAGSGGSQEQAAAIAALESGPEFSALTRSGEEAILQNASATGGLRGGNIQEALSKFRPEVLSGLISQQFSRLGGITSIGANAAAGQASTGMNLGTNISNLYGQQGAASAGAALARGQATADMFGNIAGAAGYGMGAFATPMGTPGGLPSGASLFGKWGF